MDFEKENSGGLDKISDCHLVTVLRSCLLTYFNTMAVIVSSFLLWTSVIKSPDFRCK